MAPAPDRACPACRATVPATRQTCPACGLNLHYAERVGIENARRGPNQPRRPRLWDDVNRTDTIDGLKSLGRGLAIIGAIVAVIVILPVGPDITSQELERSMQTVYAREAPPAGDRGTTFECTHLFTNTREFKCTGRADVALLSDPKFKYTVRAEDRGDEVCWLASLEKDDSPSSALLPAPMSGCVRTD